MGFTTDDSSYPKPIEVLGALHFITEATVKLFRHYPGNTRYFGFVIPEFSDAFDALRGNVTARY